MFEPHGFYDIALNGRILEVNIKYAWNVEATYDYQGSVEKFIDVLKDEPWAMITIIDDFELFTPDCYPVISKLSNKACQNGLVREAVLNFTDSVKMQVFRQKRNGYPDFQREFFRTKKEALVWLKQEGFS